MKEPEEEYIVIEEEKEKKQSAANRKIFDKVLDEVVKETGRFNYDEVLSTPKFLSILLSKTNGITVLKKMIIDSQEPEYKDKWSREKVNNIVKYLEEGSRGNKNDTRLSAEEYVELLNIFELFRRSRRKLDEVKEKSPTKVIKRIYTK